jgi:DNA-binding CsgD family transcriptional regulator
MAACLFTMTVLLQSHSASSYQPIWLSKEGYWLLMMALMCLTAYFFFKKKLHKALPLTADDTLLAWEKTNQNSQASAAEKAAAVEAVSVHWQELDKQILQLKTQLEAKNKVLDHLMQHLLPEALAVESLQAPAQELFDLLKTVQLAAHFTDHELQALPTDFEQKLLVKHPDLTEEELRLCAYLFLNLNSQQIANLKAITVAGVNKARARLRKKLGLHSEVDLAAYLSQLQMANSL